MSLRHFCSFSLTEQPGITVSMEKLISLLLTKSAGGHQHFARTAPDDTGKRRRKTFTP